MNKIRINHEAAALLEALNLIARMTLSEMRLYCIDHKIHNGISGYNAAMLASKIAKYAIEMAEKEG